MDKILELATLEEIKVKMELDGYAEDGGNGYAQIKGDGEYALTLIDRETGKEHQDQSWFKIEKAQPMEPEYSGEQLYNVYL